MSVVVHWCSKALRDSGSTVSYKPLVLRPDMSEVWRMSEPPFYDVYEKKSRCSGPMMLTDIHCTATVHAHAVAWCG